LRAWPQYGRARHAVSWLAELTTIAAAWSCARTSAWPVCIRPHTLSTPTITIEIARWPPTYEPGTMPDTH